MQISLPRQNSIHASNIAIARLQSLLAVKKSTVVDSTQLELFVTCGGKVLSVWLRLELPGLRRDGLFKHPLEPDFPFCLSVAHHRDPMTAFVKLIRIGCSSF